jgi:hypothetical protein
MIMKNQEDVIADHEAVSGILAETIVTTRREIEANVKVNRRK